MFWIAPCARDTQKSLKYKNMNLPMILEVNMRKNPFYFVIKIAWVLQFF